jgi:hypothetical protein
VSIFWYKFVGLRAALHAHFWAKASAYFLDFTAMKQRNRVRDNRRFSDHYISEFQNTFHIFAVFVAQSSGKGKPIIIDQTPPHVYSRHAPTGMRESKTPEWP